MELQNILDMSTTYIFNNSEYFLTGRMAYKKSIASKQRRRREASVVEEVLVEIRPAKSIIGIPDSDEEKKWVKPSELFVVSDSLDDNYEDDNDVE